VWEVLGSSKSVVEGYGMRAKGEKEAPNNKNEFSLEIHKRGGGGGVTLLGGRTTWGRSHGSRMWMSEGVLGSSKKASGRLGKVCQGIYLVSP
jgi:hypothetical protein